MTGYRLSGNSGFILGFVLEFLNLQRVETQKGFYMETERKYFWKDKPDIGVYDFCVGNSQNSDFQIREVAVNYVHGWTEEERQRCFQGAKFVWLGCSGGWATSDNPLMADNIEDAKREFEAWYGKYLLGRIEGLQAALAAVQKEYACFEAFQRETGKEQAQSLSVEDIISRATATCEKGKGLGDNLGENKEEIEIGME